MKLFVGGFDIKYLLVGDADFDEVQRIECEPDEYLKNIVYFLESKGSKITKISEIHAVIGPGSATALRASLSIVNTLSYSLGIYLKGYSIPENWDESSLFGIIKVSEGRVEWPLVPVYQHEPRITISHKDQLQR